MDPARIVVRVLFGFLAALVLTRIAGHRAVKQIDAPSFVVALVMGDMFDDLFWSEVPASQFIVALSTLFFLDLWLSVQLFHSGSRNWRRSGT